ncbi:hypothetical protein CRUP_005694 [Coryphaenoides rupestris]|nr:hypothetical protein CRUP_005694 [Coryphaenoides rupestris]
MAQRKDDDGEPLSSTTDPGLRVYTALPPPADYQAAIQGASITPPQPGSINSGGEAAAESSEDTDQDGPCGEHRKRRRRRGKKRRVLHEHSSMDGETGASELNALHPTQDSSVSDVGGAGGDAGGDAVGGGEHLSKNRRRKLKKKRHKEKQRSLGLVPRTSALEFTYQKEADEEEEEYGEEEEEEEGKRADEVSQFLRSTMEIYLSDGSVHPELPTAAVQKLLSSIVDGGAPPSVLKRLTHLMGLVQRKEAGRLARALEDLHHGTSPLPPGIQAGRGLREPPGELTVITHAISMFFRLARLTPVERTLPGMAMLMGALGIGMCGYSSQQLALYHRPSVCVLRWAGAHATTPAAAMMGGASQRTPFLGVTHQANACMDVPLPSFAARKCP